MPDLKGHIGHGPVAGQVVFQDTQGGPRPVGNCQHRVILHGGVVGVDVDAVGRLVQHIPSGGGGFHHLNVGFLLDACHAGHAVIVGGDGGNQLAVRVHVKGGVGQRHAGLLIHLQNGQADVPHILPGDGHVLGAVPLYRLHTGGLHIPLRAGLLRDTIRSVGQFVPLKGDGAVKAGDAGGHIGAVDLLKAEHGPLQAALVLCVNFFDGKAALHIIRHGQILGAASGEGDAYGGHNLIALRGGGFRKGVFFICGEVPPDNLTVSVGGAGNGGAAAASQGELGPLKRSTARPRLDNLQAGGFGQILRTVPFEGCRGFQSRIAGVRDDIGLLRCGGVVGQEQVILRHAARCLDGKTAIIHYVIRRDTNLERTIVFLSVGVKIGAVRPAGVHLVAGGPVFLHRLQGGIVLRYKDGALGSIGRIHFGLALIDPGGGSGGHIHHTGVICFPVDGFLFNSVCTILSGSR